MGGRKPDSSVKRPADDSSRHRLGQYLLAASQKRRTAIGDDDPSVYYGSLVLASKNRADTEADKDRRQISKDLPRTFDALALGQGKDVELLFPMLYRILTAYIERGRSLSVTKRTQTFGGRRYDARKPTATHLHSRGLLTGYPQGLNFLAGMSLWVAGAATCDFKFFRAGEEAPLEQAAFWLLALLLEDVLDPDFFGADVKDNMQMAYIGGLALRTLVVQHAQGACPALFDALGHEAFHSCVSVVLDQWVLSLFIGCMPRRLLEGLWDRLLLSESDVISKECHDSRDHRTPPRGLAYTVAFTLAALRCCGDEKLRGSQILDWIESMRLGGATSEEISLEAGEIVKRIRESLLTWPPEEDAHLLDTASKILSDFMQHDRTSEKLWDAVREQKQRIEDCAGNIDDQLVALARRTHFSQYEIQRLRLEFESIVRRDDDKIDLKTFKEIVSRSVPEFPMELCGRLFDKLDAFCVCRLSFVELICGMSALSLGTMDEKLQVCFDLFDSKGHRALTLKDLGDLCTVLFRVALAQGSWGANKASTVDVMNYVDGAVMNRRQVSIVSDGSSPPASPQLSMQKFEPRPATFTLVCEPECSTPVANSQSFRQDMKTPWRSMLLRLLSAAQARTPGGPLLVGFEDFRKAAHMEPALLGLFSWCLPPTPESNRTEFHLSRHGGDGMETVPRGVCACLFLWVFWWRQADRDIASLKDAA